MRYIDYLATSGALDYFSMALFGHGKTIWFQAGAKQWFGMVGIVAGVRNSSLGAAFGAKRPPGRSDGVVESPHVCLKNPCPSKRSKTTHGRTLIHLARISYSDGTAAVPD